MGNNLMIDAGSLHPFRDNPFLVRKDESYYELKHSIESDGIHEPLVVIADKEKGGYEIISGQRRYECAKELGLETIPVIIKNINRDEAVIAVVDNNIGLRNILPSEKAFGYKMKLDAMKHQGRRTDIYGTGGNDGHKSRDDVSNEISGRQVQRYVRLTELIPGLLELVDSGRIGISPAVEISYLPKDVQNVIYDTYADEEVTPTVGQARRMRELSADGKLDADTLDNILSECKANQFEHITIRADKVRKLFGEKYSIKDMGTILENALEYYSRAVRFHHLNPVAVKDRTKDDAR